MTGESSVTIGQVMGTVAYLAPEQIEQGATDPRTDVYACGVMMFEMLTGSKPHVGDSPMQVIYQHLSTDVPPPSTLVPGLAPQLDAITVAATSRDANGRPHDAVELLAALQQVRRGLSPAQLDTEPNGSHATLHLGRAAARQNAVPNHTTVMPPLGAVGAGAAAPTDRTSMLPELPPDMIMPRRQPQEDFAPPPPPPPSQRRAGRGGRRRRSWLLPLSVLVVVGLVGGGVTYALNSALYISMPSVVGQAQGTAEQQLQNDGLTVAVTQEFDGAVPAGQVISTDPAAGASVRKDSTVTLEVSRGADRPPVPDVVGMTQSAAESAITGADLTVGTVTQQSSGSVPQGKVIGADPAVGTPEQPKTLVNLVVSSGPQPVNVPNVVGEPQGQATSDLQNAGFAVQVNPNQVSSAVPAGSVATMSPPGSSAAAGSTITLTISSGPAQVTVPDVSGDTEAQARTALNAAGFKVKVHHYSLFGTPTVVSEDPSGGSQADQGSTVTITLF